VAQVVAGLGSAAVGWAAQVGAGWGSAAVGWAAQVGAGWGWVVAEASAATRTKAAWTACCCGCQD
jgi:hypothetical protein